MYIPRINLLSTEYSSSLEATRSGAGVAVKLGLNSDLVKKFYPSVGSLTKVEKDEVDAPDHEGFKGVIDVVEELSKSNFAERKRLSKLQRIKNENQETLSRDLEKLLSVQVDDVENSEVFTSVKKVYLKDNFVIMQFEHLVKPM